MQSWMSPAQSMPDEKEEVTVRIRGQARPRYYRIGDRWYAVVDLERWRMNTSPYWPVDRSWYLKTDQVEGWRQE